MIMQDMQQGYNLLGLLSGLFRQETIEDYTCVKCSIREYLKTNGREIKSKALKTFFEGQVDDCNELDEDEFTKQWRAWKKRTRDPSKISFDFIKRTIIRSMQLVKPPEIMCVHISRVAYSPSGVEILNSSPVTFPQAFQLSEILPQKALDESNNTEIKYKLAAMIEH